MKKLFFVLSLLLVCISSFAQRKQKTEDYVNSAMDDMPFNMFGTMTYGYIVNEDGSHTKDGPLKANCNINRTLSDGFTSIKMVGNSTVSANLSKGDLNGALNSTWNATLTMRNKTEKHSASLKGAFKNGLPHGLFVVSCKSTYKTSLTANYKNGMLVGNFSCSVWDGGVVEYSGLLTQTGKMTGKWNLDGDDAQFLNGILISISKKNHSTKPAIAALAKKYAEGTLTKKDLYKKSIVVKIDSVALGDHANTAILRDGGVEFKDLGGYDFTTCKQVYYEYLEEVAMLNDKGFQALKELCKERYVDFAGVSDINNKYQFFYNYTIRGLENDAPYVSVYTKDSLYYKTNSVPNDWKVDAGITMEQYEEIVAMVDSLQKGKAVTLKEYAMAKNGTLKTYLSQDYGQNPGDYYWTNVKNEMEKVYEDAFVTHAYLKPCPNDSLYLMAKKETDLFPKFYVKKNSLGEFKEVYDNLDQEIEKQKIASATLLEDFLTRKPYIGDSNIRQQLKNREYISWKDSIVVMKAVKATYDKTLKPILKAYPSAENHLVYVYEENGEKELINKASVDKYNRIEEEIQRIEMAHAISLTELMTSINVLDSRTSLWLKEEISGSENGRTKSSDRNWEVKVKMWDKVKVAYESYLKPYLRAYPSAENFQVYVYEANGKKSYIQKNSVRKYDVIDEEIEKITDANTIDVLSFLIQKSYLSDPVKTLLKDNNSASDWKALEQILIGAKASYENRVKNYLLAYTVGGKCIAYAYHESRGNTYLKKASVEEFNNIDQQIIDLRVKNALTLSDFFVQTSFADEHACNYLAKRPFKKYSSVIKGMQKAFEKFQKAAKPYPSETDPQAYTFDIEGVIYYINKKSVEEFPAIIERAKAEKEAEK